MIATEFYKVILAKKYINMSYIKVFKKITKVIKIIKYNKNIQ